MPKTQRFTSMQLLELRSEMEEDFARLLRSMAEEQEHGSPSSNVTWSPEPDSDSVDLGAMLRAQAQTRLTAVSAALRRLDTGAYGQCVRCGSRISFGRLSVMPEATLCIACGST